MNKLKLYQAFSALPARTLVFTLGLSILSLFQAGDAQAQFGKNSRSRSSIDDRNTPTFGVKAGINRSNVWDEQGQDFQADAKTGFVGGAFLVIPLSTYLGLQPEILLSQKGLQGSGTLLLVPYSFTRTTTYIDVPLMLQVKPLEMLSIVFGPQYSFLIRERNVYSFGGNNVVLEEAFNNDNIRKNLLGAIIGADFTVDHLVISGRAGWDFLNNHGDGTSSTPRYKNQWLQLTVGFKI
ncbi:MAG: PorT family protein [Sphingobacteriaceae bacterium]|nr:PorT family protein [Sphingobacteriaceae bacterium]